MDLLGLYLNKTCATYFPPCITENGITCFQECNYNVIIKFCFGISHKLLQWCTSRHAISMFYYMLPIVTITISMLYIKELTQQDVWKTQDSRKMKMCGARLCIPNLTWHFFVILPSWVFQPSRFCLSSQLLYSQMTARLNPQKPLPSLLVFDRILTDLCWFIQNNNALFNNHCDWLILNGRLIYTIRTLTWSCWYFFDFSTSVL